LFEPLFFSYIDIIVKVYPFYGGDAARLAEIPEKRGFYLDLCLHHPTNMKASNIPSNLTLCLFFKYNPLIVVKNLLMVTLYGVKG
jgi:hypothetical protein